MYFGLTEEQLLIKQAAHDFVEAEVAPVAKALDATHEFPWGWVHRCAELGFLGISIPEDYGGAGATSIEQMLIMEEVSRHSASLGLIIDAHSSLGCLPLLKHGTEEQKQKYLIPAAKGEKLMSFGLTEPQAGSDAGSTDTTAVADGEEWVINGNKAWITNAGVAETYIITAKTDPEKGTRGISAFIIEKDTPGFTIGEPEQKMGMNNSFTAQLFFQDCRIPKANLLGEMNRGFPLFLEGLDEGRIAISAMAVGLAQGALERATDYAKQRYQFGVPIAQHQAVAFKLADMATQIEVARAMLYQVARLRESGQRFTAEAAMLKLFASEMACRVADDAVQIHGGNGYGKDYDVERFFRDAKLLTIGEGTSEICKMVISASLLR